MKPLKLINSVENFESAVYAAISQLEVIIANNTRDLQQTLTYIQLLKATLVKDNANLNNNEAQTNENTKDDASIVLQ